MSKVAIRTDDLDGFFARAKDAAGELIKARNLKTR
jgi:hypothetical protein